MVFQIWGVHETEELFFVSKIGFVRRKSLVWSEKYTGRYLTYFIFSLHNSRSKTFHKILIQAPDGEFCFIWLQGCTFAKKGLVLTIWKDFGWLNMGWPIEVMAWVYVMPAKNEKQIEPCRSNCLLTTLVFIHLEKFMFEV